AACGRGRLPNSTTPFACRRSSAARSSPGAPSGGSRRNTPRRSPTIRRRCGWTPRATPACLRLAGAYGTCPAAKPPSPARAIAPAKGACELSGYRDPNCVQVLAALHAQAGNFEAAVKWQSRVLTMPLAFGAHQAEQRLEQYRQRKSPEWDLERNLTDAAVLKGGVRRPGRGLSRGRTSPGPGITGPGLLGHAGTANDGPRGP